MLKMTVDMNGATIAIASAGFAPKITSRTFDRPTGPADIVNHKFGFMSEKTKDCAVSEIPIFFFEKGKFMSNAPHSLRRRM